MTDEDRQPNASLFERLRGLLGLNPGSVRDDIEEALAEAGAGADFSPKERAILTNVLALHDIRVADVMSPRADVVALPLDATVAQALATFRTAGHSRLPVYRETLDDPRGMIHIRDFLDFLAADPAFGLIAAESPSPGAEGQRFDMATPLDNTALVRPLLFAPPSMPALDLLARMQASRIHIALVIDEYGGTDGLVSMEDIVETIVGNIEDEHDVAEGEQIALGPDGRYTVEARARRRRSRRGRGRRHHRRAGRGHRRPGASARRDRGGSAGLRVRGAGRRSAPAEAGQDSPPRRDPGVGAHRRKGSHVSLSP